MPAYPPLSSLILPYPLILALFQSLLQVSEQALNKFNSDSIHRGNLRTNTLRVLDAINLTTARHQPPPISLAELAEIRARSAAACARLSTLSADQDEAALTRKRPASLAALSASSSAFPPKSDALPEGPAGSRASRFPAEQLGGFSAAKVQITLDFEKGGHSLLLCLTVMRAMSMPPEVIGQISCFAGNFILAKAKMVKGTLKVNTESGAHACGCAQLVSFVVSNDCFI